MQSKNVILLSKLINLSVDWNYRKFLTKFLQ